MRVIMIEPQGQGGICHYTYSLCGALAETQGADVTLVTGRPYELVDAPRRHALTPAFGSGLGRKVIQWALRRPDLRVQAQPALAVTSAERAPQVETHTTITTTPYRTTSLAGRSSRWLAQREVEHGWRRALHEARASQNRPTVAHIQWLTDPDRDRKWIEALRVRHIPVVLTAHNVLPHDAPSESRWIWTRVYEAVDGIIVHYQQALDDLSDLEIDLAKVVVIPHGNYCAIRELTAERQLSPDLPEPSNADAGELERGRAAARRHLGLSPSAPVVLCFGLMRPYKGIQVLLSAFAAVRQALPEARLILAGRAPAGFAAVEADIRRHGLEAATVALPTYLPLQDVARVFEACDVVALPYVEASQSGVAQMAYAYGRPVVATRVGGIPDAVMDGETGILVDPRSPEQLAQALVALLRNREQCARVGIQARRVAVERFAWEPIAAHTIQMYTRALAGWPWGAGAWTT